MRESERQGLTLNAKKTVCMVMTDESVIPACRINVKGQLIQQVNKFCYLGSYITSNGRSSYDIKTRIAQGKQAFIKLDSILTSSKISWKTRYRILKSHVWSVMLYGCESWSLLSCSERKLRSAETWCIRRMLGIVWSDHISNEAVWRRSATLGIKPDLMPTVVRRQLSFIGHLVRSDAIECMILTRDCSTGHRTRGRPRYSIWDNLKRWLNKDFDQLIIDMCDHRLWRAMIANAAKQYGTP